MRGRVTEVLPAKSLDIKIHGVENTCRRATLAAASSSAPAPFGGPRSGSREWRPRTPRGASSGRGRRPATSPAVPASAKVPTSRASAAGSHAVGDDPGALGGNPAYDVAPRRTSADPTGRHRACPARSGSARSGRLGRPRLGRAARRRGSAWPVGPPADATPPPRRRPRGRRLPPSRPEQTDPGIQVPTALPANNRRPSIAARSQSVRRSGCTCQKPPAPPRHRRQPLDLHHTSATGVLRDDYSVAGGSDHAGGRGVPTGQCRCRVRQVRMRDQAAVDRHDPVRRCASRPFCRSGLPTTAPGYASPVPRGRPAQLHLDRYVEPRQPKRAARARPRTSARVAAPARRAGSRNLHIDPDPPRGTAARPGRSRHAAPRPHRRGGSVGPRGPRSPGRSLALKESRAARRRPDRRTAPRGARRAPRGRPRPRAPDRPTTLVRSSLLTRRPPRRSSGREAVVSGHGWGGRDEARRVVALGAAPASTEERSW